MAAQKPLVAVFLGAAVHDVGPVLLDGIAAAAAVAPVDVGIFDVGVVVVVVVVAEDFDADVGLSWGVDSEGGGGDKDAAVGDALAGAVVAVLAVYVAVSELGPGLVASVLAEASSSCAYTPHRLDDLFQWLRDSGRRGGGVEVVVLAVELETVPQDHCSLCPFLLFLVAPP